TREGLSFDAVREACQALCYQRHRGPLLEKREKWGTPFVFSFAETQKQRAILSRWRRGAPGGIAAHFSKSARSWAPHLLHCQHCENRRAILTRLRRWPPARWKYQIV